MNKKVVIGIVIGVIVLLILILGYGEVTGKFSIFGRRYKEGQYAFSMNRCKLRLHRIRD